MEILHKYIFKGGFSLVDVLWEDSLDNNIFVDREWEEVWKIFCQEKKS